MKLYVIIVTILSTLFGIMPLYLGKISGIDAEACATDTWFETRECVIFLDRGLLIFVCYFALAAIFFTILFLCRKSSLWLLKQWLPRQSAAFSAGRCKTGKPLTSFCRRSSWPCGGAYPR